MPFEHINLRLANCDWNSAVNKTVDTLLKGGVAVVPTETVYGLAARLYDTHAINKLIELKGRNPNSPFALAFPNTDAPNADAIEDFGIAMSPLAKRLARRSLPGPVSLVLDVPVGSSPFWKLPAEVQQAVSLHSAVSCRVPDHPLLLPVLGELNEPIVLTSANKSGCGENTNIEQIIADLGEGINLLIDEGPITEPKPSTIVKIVGNDYTILREGLLKPDTIKRLSALMILFVCAGNTCRSPMAEHLCETLLAERLHCSVEELDHRGIVVMSAGLTATEGRPATAKTIEVLREFGIESDTHRTLQLNEMHVRFADYIFVMTRLHRERILSHWPQVDSRLYVLRSDGGDIIDPIGSSQNVYRACAEQIQTALSLRTPFVLEGHFAAGGVC